VVPFDVDEMLYRIDVYKNDILMYTCNREQVYDLDIYTTNAVNNVVTIIFTLNGKEVLRLEYYAILLIPSMAEDVTEMWLAYQAERYNQTVAGRGSVSLLEQSLQGFNIATTTGLFCLAFLGVSVFNVLFWQLIKVGNVFSGVVWFGSGIFFLNKGMEIDSWVRSLSFVTQEDNLIRFANLAMWGFIIIIANLVYLIGYKATSTRLRKKVFMAIDKKNREITLYNAVLDFKGQDAYWRPQDSWSALLRRFGKVDYKIYYDYGNITDNFRLAEAKTIPENLGIHKNMNAIIRNMKEVYGKTAFIAIDKTGEIKPVKEKDQAVNYDAWKIEWKDSPFMPISSICVIDGKPDFRRVEPERKKRELKQRMKEAQEESIQPELIKGAIKRLRKLKKESKKPAKGWGVFVNLANPEIYSVIDYTIKPDIFDAMQNEIIKDKKNIARLERQEKIEGWKSYKYEEDQIEEMYDEIDKELRQQGGTQE